MRSPLHIVVTAAAILASAGIAAAASSGTTAGEHGGAPAAKSSAANSSAAMSNIILTAQDRKSIWNGLSAMGEQKTPARFHAAIGADLPKSVALHAFPQKVADSVLTLAGMKYAKMNDRVLVVRSRDRKIESVITKASAQS
jgi:hypothetical protein